MSMSGKTTQRFKHTDFLVYLVDQVTSKPYMHYPDQDAYDGKVYDLFSSQSIKKEL